MKSITLILSCVCCICFPKKSWSIHATIGILVPVKVTDGSVPLSFRQTAVSTLLAVHHINTRNGSLVGDAVDLLPLGFQLKYKIADSHFSISGGVEALLRWRNQESYEGFEKPDNISAIISTEDGPLHAAQPSDRIDAIICTDLSEVSVAVSVIAGFGGIPVTGSFSTSTTLSDKTKFPLFSRTVPVQSFNMLGMAMVISSFGWTQFAVLFLDSEYGNSMATELLRRSSEAGIHVTLMQKFMNRDAASIAAGVAALHSSGARVFVTILQGRTNLELILAAAARAGISGVDGFAWFAGADLSSDLCCISSGARPMLLGWLFLRFDPLYGDNRQRFSQAFAAADRAAVRNPLVEVTEPWFFSAPHRGFDALAYDAVWATALGLASLNTDPKAADGTDSKVKSDSCGDSFGSIEAVAGEGGRVAGGNKSASDGSGRGGCRLVKQIRKGRFFGATGQVAFDAVTGDRSAVGLKVQIMNVQPDTSTAEAAAQHQAAAAWIAVWENATLEQTAANDTWWAGLVGVEVGVWEQSEGFKRNFNSTPVWPGGRTSWDAPWDGTMWNEATLPPKLVSAAFVTLALALLAGAAAGATLARRGNFVATERQMMAMAAVRARLGIRREDGFVIVGLEQGPAGWWWRNRLGWGGGVSGEGRRRVVALRRDWVEAAALLSLLEDFDVAMLDSLCNALRYDEPDATGPSPAKACLGAAAECLAPSARALPRAGLGSNGSVDYLDCGDAETGGRDGGGRREEYQRLCEWLLDLSRALLRSDKGLAPATAVVAGGEERSRHPSTSFVCLVRPRWPATELKSPLMMDTSVAPAVGSADVACTTEVGPQAGSRIGCEGGDGAVSRWETRRWRLSGLKKHWGGYKKIPLTLLADGKDRVAVTTWSDHATAQSSNISQPLHATNNSVSFGRMSVLEVCRNRTSTCGELSEMGFERGDNGGAGWRRVTRRGSKGTLTMDSPAADRFEYLVSRVLRCTVWRDDGGALFAQLKEVAKSLIAELAGYCDHRFIELSAGPRGGELCRLKQLPDRGQCGVSSMRGRLAVRPPTIGRTGTTSPNGASVSIEERSEAASVPSDGSTRWKNWRQDDPMVRAIRVDDDDRQDAISQRLLHPHDHILIENVFIAQLARRSRLLNDQFQTLVSRAIRAHAVDPRDRVCTGLQPCGSGGGDTGFTRASSDSQSSAGTCRGRDDRRAEESRFTRTSSVDRGGCSGGASRQQAALSVPRPREKSGVERVVCLFDRRPSGFSSHEETDGFAGKSQTLEATVLVISEPEKQEQQIQEKLVELAAPDGPGEWPLTAYVLDPIRASIICDGADQMLQVLAWFTEGEADTGLPVCCIHNTFACPRESIEDGLRDLKVSVLMTGNDGLRIIAEIQIHDSSLFDLKCRMHRLYRIKRASDPQNIWPSSTRSFIF